MVKTCGSFAEVKKPEHAVKLFVRFALAKGVISHGMELMMALLSIVQGVISSIMNAAGFGSPQETVLPTEIITAVEGCGFFESIPLWAVTLIGGLFIWVLSFVMILSVYGRFFKMYTSRVQTLRIKQSSYHVGWRYTTIAVSKHQDQDRHPGYRPNRRRKTGRLP